MICTLWASAGTPSKLCDISDFTTGTKVETVKLDVTKSGNGEPGTGNGERGSGNEWSAVFTIKNQNGGLKSQ